MLDKERVQNGVRGWRNIPGGSWTPFTPEQRT